MASGRQHPGVTHTVLCAGVYGGKAVLEGIEHPGLLWLLQVNEWLRPAAVGSPGYA